MLQRYKLVVVIMMNLSMLSRYLHVRPSYEALTTRHIWDRAGGAPLSPTFLWKKIINVVKYVCNNEKYLTG